MLLAHHHKWAVTSSFATAGSIYKYRHRARAHVNQTMFDMSTYTAGELAKWAAIAVVGTQVW